MLASQLEPMNHFGIAEVIHDVVVCPGLVDHVPFYKLAREGRRFIDEMVIDARSHAAQIVGQRLHIRRHVNPTRPNKIVSPDLDILAKEPVNAVNRLGPVGAQIVGEVLIGLLDMDPTSVRHTHADWQPDFSLVELLLL
jgi:hypothetical protein